MGHMSVTEVLMLCWKPNMDYWNLVYSLLRRKESKEKVTLPSRNIIEFVEKNNMKMRPILHKANWFAE